MERGESRLPLPLPALSLVGNAASSRESFMVAGIMLVTGSSSSPPPPDPPGEWFLFSCLFCLSSSKFFSEQLCYVMRSSSSVYGMFTH